MNQSIKNWLPPAVLNLWRSWRKLGANYSGNYASWQEAQFNSTGYDSHVILEKVSSALLKVKSGEAVYERDSVLFDKIEHSFPLLAGLLRAAVENEGKLNVLDFGGSLGSTYFQCRNFLSALPHMNWCIVEQENYVLRGRELFETEQLHFCFTMLESMQKIKPNVILFSSVLQYVQSPFEFLKQAIDSESEYIIIDRTPFSNADKNRLCIQKVPSKIYESKLSCWIFSLHFFKETLSGKFNLIADFECNEQIDGIEFKFMGSIWQRRKIS